MSVAIFPRTHGSAFFQRGETQSLVTCTLGTIKDEQIVDGLLPEYAKKFYLHYNFPPFCTGEAGRIAGPGRRELGHGALAERSLLAILPVRGVPLHDSRRERHHRVERLVEHGVGLRRLPRAHGRGRPDQEHLRRHLGRPLHQTATGKVTHVTDIIGEEDFFGEMDFKVSGTREGITGIQLDLKARGLGMPRSSTIFAQAKEGRLHIIDADGERDPAPRADISQVRAADHHGQDRPREDRQAHRTGRQDDPLASRSAPAPDRRRGGWHRLHRLRDAEKAAQARAEVEALGAEIKVGTIYDGKVVSIKDFGAFVELVPGTDGMVHVSELAHGYVKTVSDVVKIGDPIRVKVINVDDTGRIKSGHLRALQRDRAAGRLSNAQGRRAREVLRRSRLEGLVGVEGAVARTAGEGARAGELVSRLHTLVASAPADEFVAGAI
jgi:polyribonucleotide nucleotidyltransferase